MGEGLRYKASAVTGDEAADRYVTGSRDPADYPGPLRWPWIHHLGHTVARRLGRRREAPTPERVEREVGAVLSKMDDASLEDLAIFLAGDATAGALARAAGGEEGSAGVATHRSLTRLLGRLVSKGLREEGREDPSA